MKAVRLSHIVLTVCAVFAAAVLFVTYGTVLPAAPFASIQLDGPTAADSNGKLTVVVDTNSRRALIMNSDGDLTGVISCTTADSRIDAITDVCVVDDLVYLSGVRFAPDSDAIQQERVVVFDKGGNYKTTSYELEGSGSETLSIIALCDALGGVVLARQDLSDLFSMEGAGEGAKSDSGAEGAGEGAKSDSKAKGAALQLGSLTFELIGTDEPNTLKTIGIYNLMANDAALSSSDGSRYAVLSNDGTIGYSSPENAYRAFAGHVFTSIDIDDSGTVYACDDVTGALCAISPGSRSARELVAGKGYQKVHVNGGVISLCDIASGKVMLCDTSGDVKRDFSEVTPSVGFSARMVLVWASGLYLGVLALVLAVRKLRRKVKKGETREIGAMLTAVAVVSALAVAVGSLSLTSYQSSLDLRAREINMCADYLDTSASSLSKAMEGIGSRSVFREYGKPTDEFAANMVEALNPSFTLVYAANKNDIGLYFNLYGKDDRGIFYLYDSANEHVMGTSVRQVGDGELSNAFETGYEKKSKLLKGRTLRDATQYRLIQIPSSDGKGVVGVIEIGSRMRSFESSITNDLAQRILALLVMVLVVYLAYSELRACGRCLFAYRERQREDDIEAVALLTRPSTLGITMLMSIDSVMTVLIARDLLSATNMGASNPLVALPAVMLGIGLIVGQGLYGLAGARVGLRRLMASGALAALLCACITGAAVAFGSFWMYCATKLLMSVPFGMLYALGYSLPRLAKSEEVRASAAGDVKRTDTSAAALGTVLGGYAAQVLGNGWVYVLVAAACLLVIFMALNLLPRGMRPLETLAQPSRSNGRIRDFVKTPAALALAFLIVLPAAVAAGYASFLFPLFSIDLGLDKAQINNIFVLGQLVVYVCIGQIGRMGERIGKWRMSTVSVALLGAVFLLFSVNTTLAWSFAVVALVGLLCKGAEEWRAMWLKAAGEACVPAGSATSAMFATRSLALVVQPFILSGLIGMADSVAVIVIGLICVVCAAMFFLTTRNSALNEKRRPRQSRSL